MMLAEQDHRARLRALGALGMLRDKAHFVADRELVEPAVCDAVAVEVDLIAIGAQDEAAIRPWSGTMCSLTSPRPWRT